MQISFKVTGLDEIKRQLGSLAKQVPFAASKALNNTAFAVNAGIKREMQSAFKGGPSKFAERAFRVETSDKKNLIASVVLRDDAPPGGTPYSKALHHLFTGGTRDWKRVEGYLRTLGLIPAGLMAVPGAGCPLDKRGNITRAAWTEMLGVIKSNIRNLRVYRKTGAGKKQKAVGYFVVKPGDTSKLRPGIYKRIQTGTTSGIDPMIMFVKRGTWRKFIDLELVGKAVMLKTFASEFEKEFANARKSAK